MKKKASELKPGDIFWIQQSQFIYLRAKGPDLDNDGVDCFALGETKERITVRYLSPNDVYLVSSPELTPAQEHADELLELARRVSNLNSHTEEQSTLRADSWDLLDKIDPPKPPTLEEALYALDLITNKLEVIGMSGQRATAQDVLDRARRSGVFK